MSEPESQRIWRAGVRFNWAEYSRLLRDDDQHAATLAATCRQCEGDLRLVGEGKRLVEFANGSAAARAQVSS